MQVIIAGGWGKKLFLLFGFENVKRIKPSSSNKRINSANAVSTGIYQGQKEF